jgi:hypothetical protein
MATEAFLINPPKKRKKRRTTAKRRVTRKRVHRPVLYEVSPKRWKRGPKSKSRAAGVKINPIGEGVMIVGANPPRRRKTKRRRRRNPWYGQPIRHSRAAKKGWRRRRRRTTRRRYRRNPAVSAPSILNLRRPMNMVMPLAVGVVAKMATDRVPVMVNMADTPLKKFGVQMGVAFAGNMLLRRPLGSVNANVWAIVSAVTAVSELVGQYITGRAISGIGAIGYEPEYSDEYPVSEGVGAFPEEIGAYPYENTIQY